MNKQELKAIWDEFEISCRLSITPEYAQKFCARLGLELPKEYIYTKLKYREQCNGNARVDCEDLLIFACKQFNIIPDPKRIALSNKMFGEGSRRECVEEAYLGGD